MSSLRSMAGTVYGRPALALGLLVALALLLRVTFFLEMRATPYYEQHAWAETDMAFFDTWSEGLAAGDWIDASGTHPHHAWHESVAARHFARTGVAPTTPDAGEKLWHGWYGSPRFHQEPLYAYSLGLLKRLGGGPGWMFALQTALGAFAVVLVQRVTLRAFGAPASMVAATLAVFTGPLMFYEGILLRATPLLIAGLAGMLAAQRALDKPTRGRLIAAGLVLGGAVLLKSTFVLFAVTLGAALVFFAEQRPKALRGLGWLVAGIALVLAPAVARNLAAGAGPLSLSSVGPVTFINSNAAGYRAGSGFKVSEHCEELMAEHHDSFAAAAVAAVATHPGPLAWAGLAAKKALFFFLPYELPNNTSYRYYRQVSFVLGYLQFGFVWVAVPGLLGMALAARRSGRMAALLAAGLACGYLPLVAFYNLSRFRAPLIGLILPFAAFGVVEGVRLVRRRRWRRLLVAAAVPAIVFGAIGTLERPDRNIRTVDYVETNRLWMQTIAEIERDSGAVQALAATQRALGAAPRTILRAVSEAPEATERNRVLADSFGPLTLACARLARLAGDEKTEQRCARQARALHDLVRAP